MISAPPPDPQASPEPPVPQPGQDSPAGFPESRPSLPQPGEGNTPSLDGASPSLDAGSPPGYGVFPPGVAGAAQPGGKKTDGWSVGLVVFNILVLMLAGAVALVLFATGLMGTSQAVSQAADFSYAWISLLVALVQIPPLLLSIARLMGRSLPRLPQSWLGLGASTLLLVIAWPLTLLAGSLLESQSGLAARLGSGAVQVLAIGIPLYWLVQLGRRGLAAGSAQRGWGVTSVSAAFTMPVILATEALVLVLVVIVALLVLALQPTIAAQLRDLSSSLRPGGVNPQDYARLLEPYLQQPGVLFLGLALIGGVMPLLEELFKPLAVWFLARRNFGPIQGFNAGLLAGACFAMLESFSAVTGGSILPSSGFEGTWVGVVILRSATGIIHIACSGLVGWGLGEAWQNQRYLRLAALYLLAGALHGTWNTLAVLQSLGGQLSPEVLGPLNGSDALAGAGMLVVLAVSFAVLVFASRILLRYGKDNINHGDTENTENKITTDSGTYPQGNGTQS